MCIVCIANNINRNVCMYLNTRIFPTTGYARVLLFMFIRRELGGMVQDVYFSLHTVFNTPSKMILDIMDGFAIETSIHFRGGGGRLSWKPLVL